jgi:cyclopropane fatty-acyl-phospholipid synthase-like methyltransferase
VETASALARKALADFEEALASSRYKRSSKYSAKWLLDLDMGPNPLWLLEDLSTDLRLDTGMQVLDLGSGKGASSVFLVKEFGVEVWAADLWVDADTAAQTFRDAGVDKQAHALKAEAHALPFARRSFDAIISIDAFEYFGTFDTYINYITRYLKPGGQIAIATAALTKEVRELGAIPQHIHAVVGTEALAWHTAEWWRFQWDKSERVTVQAARFQEQAWLDWLIWSRAAAAHAGKTVDEDPVVKMLEADGGDYLTFALVAATLRE